MEVGKLKKRIAEFDTTQADFRHTFEKMRFYKFRCKRPYEHLNLANQVINEHEQKMKTLQVQSEINEYGHSTENSNCNLCYYRNPHHCLK